MGEPQDEGGRAVAACQMTDLPTGCSGTGNTAKLWIPAQTALVFPQLALVAGKPQTPFLTNVRLLRRATGATKRSKEAVAGLRFAESLIMESTTVGRFSTAIIGPTC